MQVHVKGQRAMMQGLPTSEASTDAVVVGYPSYNDIHDFFSVKYLVKGAGTEAK